MKEKYIDQEEKEIIESFNESFDFDNAPKPSKNKVKEMRKAAKEFVRSETKMNIRIEQEELQKIKDAASLEGLRYQTFIKSVLHKYITGQLVDKSKLRE